jgi:hypothetical protein
MASGFFQAAKFAAFEVSGTVAVLQADTGRHKAVIDSMPSDADGLTFAGSNSFVALSTPDHHSRRAHLRGYISMR